MPTKVDTRWAKFQTERESVRDIMGAFKFNEDFMLGIATSSTQIEGADPNNTWYQWCSDLNSKRVVTKSEIVQAVPEVSRFNDLLAVFSSDETCL